MPEFSSDEHRGGYIAALVHEKAGYEARAAQPVADADAMARRAAQVQAELDRLAGAAKPAGRRAERR